MSKDGTVQKVKGRPGYGQGEKAKMAAYRPGPFASLHASVPQNMKPPQVNMKVDMWDG